MGVVVWNHVLSLFNHRMMLSHYSVRDDGALHRAYQNYTCVLEHILIPAVFYMYKCTLLACDACVLHEHTMLAVVAFPSRRGRTCCGYRCSSGHGTSCSISHFNCAGSINSQLW